MNLPVNIFLGMVNNLVGVLGSQTFIGNQGVGVESRASFYMLLDFGLQDTSSCGWELPAPERFHHVPRCP